MTKDEAVELLKTCCCRVRFPEYDFDKLLIEGSLHKKELEAILILWEKDYD